ncbi:MAG: MerR family transcriptional regulator [Anaeroplasma sp.]
MFKIGEFSKLSKVTIKALRFYEKEGLINPAYIDEANGYRYYESAQLVEISKIVSLKQIGLSIEEIKSVLNNPLILEKVLINKKDELEETISLNMYQLSKINYLMEEKNMSNEIFEKVVPDCYVYYKEGILEDYSQASEFIYNSGKECLELNPNIKCVEPDYCFVEYLDGEYKEKNVNVRYSQAVIKTDIPFNESENIKFRQLEETKCICIYHKGAYDLLGESYGKIMKYIEDNKLRIKAFPRECYIDGIWNKENSDDWLTEIQVPIE